jgi:hypothetical protein
MAPSGTCIPVLIDATCIGPSSLSVLFMVTTRGAKVSLHDHAEYWFACVRHPGLLSWGMPRGRENAPVGSKLRPDGVGIGVASKSEPCEPVTCGCLVVVSNGDRSSCKQCNVRFLFRLVVFSLDLVVVLLGNNGANANSDSNCKAQEHNCGADNNPHGESAPQLLLMPRNCGLLWIWLFGVALFGGQQGRRG